MTVKPGKSDTGGQMSEGGKRKKWSRVGINVEPELSYAFKSRLMSEGLESGEFVSTSDAIRRFMRCYVESGIALADMEEMFRKASGRDGDAWE